MRRTVFLFLVFLAVTSCEKNSYTTFSTKYRVFFSCNIMDSPFNQTIEPGRFVSVRKTSDGLKTTDSDGHTTTVAMSEVQNGAFILGLAGIIIGTPLFNNYDFSVWAYDLGCPECDQSNKRLTFDVNGTASCSTCGGKWDLNNNGFAVSGKYRPLYRYPVMFNMGTNTLTVKN